MTFDEWFAGLPEINKLPELKQALQQGWEGALEFAGTPSPVVQSLTLGQLVRLDMEARAAASMPPAVNDIWQVRVKGGRIESLVMITCVSATEVEVCDPEAFAKVHHNTRTHKIENLDWMKLVCRGLK